jgi:hypothetical protein
MELSRCKAGGLSEQTAGSTIAAAARLQIGL